MSVTPDWIRAKAELQKQLSDLEHGEIAALVIGHKHDNHTDVEILTVGGYRMSLIGLLEMAKDILLSESEP